MDRAIAPLADDGAPDPPLFTFGGPFGPPLVAPNKVHPQAGCGMRLAVDLRDENPTNDSAAYFPS